MTASHEKHHHSHGHGHHHHHDHHPFLIKTSGTIMFGGAITYIIGAAQSGSMSLAGNQGYDLTKSIGLGIAGVGLLIFVALKGLHYYQHSENYKGKSTHSHSHSHSHSDGYNHHTTTFGNSNTAKDD